MACLFNIKNKLYLKGLINWVIYVPGHWFFLGIQFVNLVNDVWRYKIKLGDSIKGVSRDLVMRNVQKFIRSAVSFLFYNRGVQNLLDLNKFIFEIECHTSVGDHVSPAQHDVSSCGVHACINAYFFMNEGRLATTADYTPNENGVSGLKRFLLFKLMQADLMVQHNQNSYDEQGGARGLFHQYLLLNGADAVKNAENLDLAIALQQIVQVWGSDAIKEKKVHDVIRLDMEDD